MLDDAPTPTDPGLLERLGTRPLDGNEVALLQSGAEFFPSLVAAIEAASVEVRLETYIFADDDTTPAVHSTGIDDYFGAGNLFERDAFSLPFCGLLNKKDAVTVPYRLNVADRMAFTRSFAFQIEPLPFGTKQTVISGTFFWYSESPGGNDQP